MGADAYRRGFPKKGKPRLLLGYDRVAGLHS
jgi:hypothetical protein